MSGGSGSYSGGNGGRVAMVEEGTTTNSPKVFFVVVRGRHKY